jgi:hypothetical protein
MCDSLEMSSLSVKRENGHFSLETDTKKKESQQITGSRRKGKVTKNGKDFHEVIRWFQEIS